MKLGALKSGAFSFAMLDAVFALTETASATRLVAANSAAPNAMAHAIKLADVADNMGLDRILHPIDKDLAYLEEYRQGRTLPLSAQPSIESEKGP